MWPARWPDVQPVPDHERRDPQPGPPATGTPAGGWLLVAGLFSVLMVSSGLGFYNHSLYMATLAAEKGWALSTLSGAVSLFFVVSGGFGMFVARLIDRHDVRWTMAAGSIVAGAALTLLGFAESIVQVYAAFALFGLGYSAVSLVPSTTLVARWFTTNRSVALSVASTGLSVGGVLVTPLSVWLIAQSGFAAAVPWLGLAFVALTLPIVLLMVRPWPPGRGPTAAVQAVADGVPYADAVRGRFFLLGTLAFMLVMLAQVGGIAHLFSLGMERVGAAAAGTSVSVLAVCSITGRLAGGALVSRLPMRAFIVVNMAGQGVGLMLLAHAHTAPALWLGAALFGLTVGNLLMLQPLLLAEAFGLRDYGRIYAASQGLTTLGVAAGPATVGILHDAAGGYVSAFTAVGACSLTAMVVFLAAGRANARGAEPV